MEHPTAGHQSGNVNEAELVELVERLRKEHKSRTPKQGWRVHSSALGRWRRDRRERAALPPPAARSRFRSTELQPQGRDKPTRTQPKRDPMKTLAGSFARLFSKHIEENKNDLCSLLRRKVDGQDVPLEEIVRAAREAGVDGDGVDAIVVKMERRRAAKIAAALLPGIEREAAAIEAAIRKEEVSFEEARLRHGAAVRPLNERQSEIEARKATATAAKAEVLGENLLDPVHHERLVKARAAVGALRGKPDKLKGELTSRRAHISQMNSEMKAAGIRPSDWRDKTQSDFKAKHPEATCTINSPLRLLAAEEELPAMEKEYGDVSEQLNAARAELANAEKAALES